MAIRLGDNRYGKAETRLVRVTRDGDRHELVDLNVSVALSGDLEATHLTGDNSAVLPTDTQKNTVYAFARSRGVDGPEAFGLALARHFVDGQAAIHRADISVEEYGWDRLGPHSFQRSGGEARTATVSYDGRRTEVWSGLTDLVLMNTTGSEFRGFFVDGYTTLAETSDRILATAVNARWRHVGEDADWAESFAVVRSLLVEAFVETYSASLQQTLYSMGSHVLSHRAEVDRVSLSMPNRHHFLVDLTPFGLDNPGEVFFPADRPYGLIEATVVRE
jgi:urate oxidase